MFLDNKYTRVYNIIIEAAKTATYKEYTEKHHIIPRSLGGSDDPSNLVVLSAREHFICHWLLTKMTTGSDKFKMLYALNCMRRHNPHQSRYHTKITARVYAHLKTTFAAMYPQFATHYFTWDSFIAEDHYASIVSASEDNNDAEMREQITRLIELRPKHYSLAIKKTPELLKWVEENTLTKHDHLPSMIYSAVKQVSLECEYGNKKKLDRWSSGLKNCGPAAVCQCNREDISKGVSNTKLTTDHTESNEKRKKTMLEKYGSTTNSQREEVKSILKKPKVSDEAYAKLSDKEWLYREYIEKNRTTSDIAEELGVHYTTVVEYCRKADINVPGRGKRKKSESHKESLRQVNLGKIHINKDGIEKSINKEDLNEWIAQGWKVGSKKRK